MLGLVVRLLFGLDLLQETLLDLLALVDDLKLLLQLLGLQRQLVHDDFLVECVVSLRIAHESFQDLLLSLWLLGNEQLLDGMVLAGARAEVLTDLIGDDRLRAVLLHWLLDLRCMLRKIRLLLVVLEGTIPQRFLFVNLLKFFGIKIDLIDELPMCDGGLLMPVNSAERRVIAQA